MATKKGLNDVQKLVRANQKACLSNLYDMSTLIKENQKDFVWLTRDMVNSVYTRYKKSKSLEENSKKGATDNPPNSN